LFYELCTNAFAAAEFISGILPADISGKLQDNELMKMMQTGKPVTDVELPQSTQPTFDLSPVQEPVVVKGSGELANAVMPVAVEPPLEPRPEEHVWTIKELAALPAEDFKKLMQQYAGKNVPKILLQAAMQRF
jgi:hypothetical protein